MLAVRRWLAAAVVTPTLSWPGNSPGSGERQRVHVSPLASTIRQLAGSSAQPPEPPGRYVLYVCQARAPKGLKLYCSLRAIDAPRMGLQLVVRRCPLRAAAPSAGHLVDRLGPDALPVGPVGDH